MKKLLAIILAYTFFSVFFYGCSAIANQDNPVEVDGSTPFSSDLTEETDVFKTLDRSSFSENMKRFRKLWKSRSIKSYHFQMIIENIPSTYDIGGRVIYRVDNEVNNNAVVKSSCFNIVGSSCDFFGDEKSLTVDGIFDLIQHRIEKGEHMLVTFDTSYGFPRRIIMNDGSKILITDFQN